MNVDLTSYATDHRNFCRTFLEEKKHHVPTPKSEWKGVKDLIVLFLLIIFIAHLAACGWYYVGVNSIPDQHSSNWIKEKGLLWENWQIQYMSSFYWSIVTVMTVGYGDFGSIIQDIKRDKKRFE